MVETLYFLALKVEPSYEKEKIQNIPSLAQWYLYTFLTAIAAACCWSDLKMPHALQSLANVSRNNSCISKETCSFKPGTWEDPFQLARLLTLPSSTDLTERRGCQPNPPNPGGQIDALLTIAKHFKTRSDAPSQGKAFPGGPLCQLIARYISGFRRLMEHMPAHSTKQIVVYKRISLCWAHRSGYTVKFQPECTSQHLCVYQCHLSLSWKMIGK